jgi:hypothetical protein
MSIPEMTPVDSSNVARVGHNPTTNDLYVEFLDGAIYAYSGVDAQTFEELRDAPSVGSFLNRVIKHNYPYSKLS